jgi:hypothetical protein
MAMRATWVFRLAVVGSGWLVVGGAFAKNNKPPVPGYVLRAETVAVMVDPHAGIALDDPIANQTAQRDVERAILNWGRFKPVMGAQQADLVIVLRKGHDKLAEETISDPRQNSRVGVINPMDNGIGIGAQHGPQPGLSIGSASNGTQNGEDRSHPQMEMGKAEDSFEVYEGKRVHPMDGSIGWSWVRKDGLHSHDVPAVEEFRKAIAETEKQAAKQAGKKP